MTRKCSVRYGTTVCSGINERIEQNVRDRCYDSKLKSLSNELTLILSDIRELNKVPNTK